MSFDLAYDLHLHSCLSPCGDADMTPYNLVNMAAINELEVIALTDHNTCKNCPAAIAAGEEAGILVIPGMELTTSEEVHVVCLFADLARAMEFSDYVYDRLPPIDNRPDIFGEQLIMDDTDGVIGRLDKLLINATDISVMEVAALVESYGGFCYPAHVDKSSYSLISNLGGIPPECGFTAVEISKNGDDRAMWQMYPEIRGMRRVHSSDAHYLEHIAEPIHKIEGVREKTAAAVIEALRSMENLDK